jgi:hypothetical protein
MPEVTLNWRNHTLGDKMKKVLLIIILSSLMLVIMGCSVAIAHEADSGFNFIFKYGVSGGNTLDTFQGTYTRDMILDPAIIIDLVLTAAEMDSIYQKIVEIDFFNYPDKFNVHVADNETKTEVAPYSSYFFKVEYNGKTKELLWHDKYLNSDIQGDKLKELINLIKSIIESKPEYQALPKPSGGYL